MLVYLTHPQFADKIPYFWVKLQGSCGGFHKKIEEHPECEAISPSELHRETDASFYN